MKKIDIDWKNVKEIDTKKIQANINITCKLTSETVKTTVAIKYKILQCKETKCYIRVILKPFYLESDITLSEPNINGIINLLESKLLSKYKDIALRHKKNKKMYEKLNIKQGDIKALNVLYHHAKTDKYKESYVGNIWNQNNINTIKYKISDLTKDDFKSFLSLKKFIEMITQDTCGYCGVSIDNILQLSKSKLYTKRARGYVMEIDQINSSNGYSDDNCVACCYWCNNAKTDEFSADEFKEIARGINGVWNNRFKKAEINEEVIFPKDSLIWSK